MEEEDVDLASRFVGHLEDQEMDDLRSISSNQVHARWGDRDNDDDDDGMAVAGPSNLDQGQPFQSLFLREAPL